MPKVVAEREFDQLVWLIGQHPDGISVDGVLRKLGTGVKRRTLQRRLALLVEQQRIQPRGDGRALKYHVRTAAAHGQITMPLMQVQASAEHYVPTSPESEEIRAYVRQARSGRRPVGYRMEFLEQYHPNETRYLPRPLLEQLEAMGRPVEEYAAAGTLARDILHRLLIDFSWASSRLEGNTYSLLDTKRLIEFGQAAEGKDTLEIQMILNHKQAIQYLVDEVAYSGLSSGVVISLHALLSDGLLGDPSACGRLRVRAVEIGGSVYVPIALPQRLEELFAALIAVAAEIQNPFEQAFFLMVHLPYLQPFLDVNTRVSRLAANIPLMRHNLCPLSFIDVPQQAYVDGLLGVSELNRIDLLRDVFVWAYERSCQQYMAVRQQLVPPDIFRLRYRAQLSEIVAGIVRDGELMSEALVRGRIPATIPADERDHFFALVVEEFKALHVGNAVRFGLRPLEFAAWQERQYEQ